MMRSELYARLLSAAPSDMIATSHTFTPVICGDLIEEAEVVVTADQALGI
jgi:hypothetical protein